MINICNSCLLCLWCHSNTIDQQADLSQLFTACVTLVVTINLQKRPLWLLKFQQKSQLRHWSTDLNTLDPALQFVSSSWVQMFYLFKITKISTNKITGVFLVGCNLSSTKHWPLYLSLTAINKTLFNICVTSIVKSCGVFCGK